MTMYERLQKTLNTMKEDQLKDQLATIQAEKQKRYEYHKKYNLAKKNFETALKNRAAELKLK